MVIVVMAAAQAEAALVGRDLAERLGWRCVDADAPHTSADLRVVVERSADRREPLVLACERLAAAQRSHLANGLRYVRFVSLGTALEPGTDVALVLNDAADVAINVDRIRREFGL